MSHHTLALILFIVAAPAELSLLVWHYRGYFNGRYGS